MARGQIGKDALLAAAERVVRLRQELALAEKEFEHLTTQSSTAPSQKNYGELIQRIYDLFTPGVHLTAVIIRKQIGCTDEQARTAIAELRRQGRVEKVMYGVYRRGTGDLDLLSPKRPSRASGGKKIDYGFTDRVRVLVRETERDWSAKILREKYFPEKSPFLLHNTLMKLCKPQPDGHLERVDRGIYRWVQPAIESAEPSKIGES